MLDGKIVGKFLILKPDEYIKMEWKFNDWKESSIV
jgi:activator of HSP90 ATPase